MEKCPDPLPLTPFLSTTRVIRIFKFDSPEPALLGSRTIPHHLLAMLRRIGATPGVPGPERSAKSRSRWYQAAVRQNAGRIIAAGMTKEVAFEPVDGPINNRIDDAYRAKYHGSPYFSPMIGASARRDSQGDAARDGVRIREGPNS
jgi:hypothetical protein